MMEVEEVEDVSLGELVKIYLTIRTEREKIESEWKARNGELLNDMKALEAQMLDTCNTNNAKSISTPFGTVMRRLTERYTIADGDSFRKYVMLHEVPELFEQRIAQTNFKEFIADRKDEGLPPGVNVMREFTVVVRKPSN